MQIKTIEKVIRRKLLAWLESITDEDLRRNVKKYLLLSGGSIVSLLKNEDVNDYDVYLQDQECARRLAQYYCKDQPVEVWDGAFKSDLELSVAAEYGDSGAPNNSKRAVAIRTLKPDQVKIFSPSTNGGVKIVKDLSKVKAGSLPEDEKPKPYQPKFLSPNAISLSDDIQIVLRFIGDCKKIHSTFDFVHATNYFTFEDGLQLNQDALTSIMTKQLKYQGSNYPLTSIIRSKKFVGRGWNINAGEYLKIMFEMNELDLSDINVLEEQLIGVDVAYFGELIDQLRVHAEDPAFKITPSFLNELIDKVFNEVEDEDQ